MAEVEELDLELGLAKYNLSSLPTDYQRLHWISNGRSELYASGW